MRKTSLMILSFLLLKTLLFSFSAFSFEEVAEKLKNIVADNHVTLEKKNSNTNPLGFFSFQIINLIISLETLKS
jgi:hypothetical protein